MLLKRISLALAGYILLLCLCSCASPVEEQRQFVARKACLVADDGWAYVFTSKYAEGDADFGSASDTYVPFTFYGINLRYRYSQAYTTEYPTTDNTGQTVMKQVLQSTLILGNSDSQAEREDMDKIAQYLGYERDGTYYSTAELLSLTETDLGFTCLDGEMFLSLMRQCLESEPTAPGPYPLLPSWALFTEPVYLDDYKFQIGLIGGFGTVEVLVLDVLYRTGEGLTDYVQLYDLVCAGTATAEQVLLLDTLREIEQGVAASGDLLWGQDKYGGQEISGIRLERLYGMLKNISINQYQNYIVNSH